MNKKIKEARKTAKFMGLKALTGTIKQKKWAEQIRADFIQHATEQQLEKAQNPTTSKWWIENRTDLDAKILKTRAKK